MILQIMSIHDFRLTSLITGTLNLSKNYPPHLGMYSGLACVRCINLLSSHTRCYGRSTLFRAPLQQLPARTFIAPFCIFITFQSTAILFVKHQPQLALQLSLAASINPKLPHQYAVRYPHGRAVSHTPHRQEHAPIHPGNPAKVMSSSAASRAAQNACAPD